MVKRLRSCMPRHPLCLTLHGVLSSETRNVDQTSLTLVSFSTAIDPYRTWKRGVEVVCPCPNTHSLTVFLIFCSDRPTPDMEGGMEVV